MNQRGRALRIPSGACPVGERASRGPWSLPAGAPPALPCAIGPGALSAHSSDGLNRNQAVTPPGAAPESRLARPRGSVPRPGNRAELWDPGHTQRGSAPRPRSCARAPPAISVSHWAPRPTPFLRRTARPKERRIAAGRRRGVALRSARRRSAPRWLAAPRRPRPGWLAGRGLGGRPG